MRSVMKKPLILFMCFLPVMGYGQASPLSPSPSGTAPQQPSASTFSQVSPVSGVFPQVSPAAESGSDEGNGFDKNLILTPNPQLALSVADYRVTAGDMYTLSFAAGTQTVQYVIPVDTSYRVKVANLGVVDAAGKTYSQLKAQVETIVTNNYPLSGVQFVLTAPAAFKVYIRGEVQKAQEISVWALNRLSVLTDGTYMSPYASLRNVTVQSTGGQRREYDLFKAYREGDLSQDPYLRPGDVITFGRAEKMVSIEGAVERPGIYQLLAGESLKELIEVYAGGFTLTADSTRMELVRMVNSVDREGNKMFFNERDIAGRMNLENHDAVSVPEITRLEPVMFIEGAIRVTENAELTASNQIIIRYFKGESYASLIRRNIGLFGAVSDTKNAYIIRGEEYLPVNLNPILYDYEYRSELTVEQNDTLIIPFRQYFVSVAGAVVNPGRYPYIPDRQWDYYIGLAGGFRQEQNSREVIDIADINGKALTKADIITPETIITARANSFTYYFSQYAPVITTTLSIVSTVLTIYLATK